MVMTYIDKDGSTKNEWIKLYWNDKRDQSIQEDRIFLDKLKADKDYSKVI
jgi:hypothetical protein